MSREACVYSETACSEHGQAGRNANVVPAEKTGAKWADRVPAARSILKPSVASQRPLSLLDLK